MPSLMIRRPEAWSTLLLAAACLVLGLLPATAQARDKTQFGFFDTTYAFQRPGAFWSDYHQLGAQGLRVAVNWDQIVGRKPKHPADPADPAYNWTTLDAIMQRAQSEKALGGMLATVWTTPQWARDRGQARYASDPHSYLVMPRPGMLDAFLTALITRYSGFYVPTGAVAPLPRISSYQIWNEPNDYLFPLKIRGRDVAARNYARLLTSAYETIKAYDPSLLVVTAGLDPAAYKANPQGAPYAFIRNLAKIGVPFDVLAVHGYTVPVGAGRSKSNSDSLAGAAPAFSLARIDAFSRFLQKTFGYRVRLWVTEFGWQTNPPDKVNGISLHAQSTRLRRAVKLIRSSGRVERAYWFLTRDEPLAPWTWQSGLRTASGAKKPAFKTWVSLFGRH